MTRTNLNPKVSSVGIGQDTQIPQNTVGEGPQRTRDDYISQGSNPYRNLVSGQPRAISAPPPDNSTPIGDMMGVIQNERTGRRQDPMQAFIGSLMMGDDGAGPSPTDFEIPRVPMLQRDILRRNTAGVRLRPIVQRYAALERVIGNLISNAQRAINSAGISNMDSREIESLREYKSELRERLILCRDQLAEARRAYNQERIDNPPESDLDEEVERPQLVFTGTIRTVGS